MNSNLASSFLPLSPAMLHILLALAAEDLHGYAIMQEIAQHSQGQYKIGPGTLYDNLQKMMNQELVEESHRAGRGEDARRRYYRVTSLGRAVLAAEVDRLEDILRHAKVHLRFAHGRRS